MKIAIYGGAFNPVHNEHVNIVKAALTTLNADRVIVVPTNISPHKSGKITPSPQARLQMCRLAFANVPNTEISDFEIANGGVSYSYITCEHFKSLYPNAELYFIMGADMLKNFSSWKNPNRILKAVTLAACAREDGEEFIKIKLQFAAQFNAPLRALDYVGKSVSSTEVRALAALGEDITWAVCKNVAEYIKANSVYLQKNIIDVKSFLTPERWQHTVRVAKLALKKAQQIGEDELTVLTAATLHDCAKYLSLNSEYLKDFIPPQNVPDPVIHQFAGAYMAYNYFNVKNEGVISAIKYHASGKPNMTPLEKLIYLADMLEEGRSFDGVEKLRELFDEDIDACFKAALEHQIKYLNGTGKPVYALTQQAYDYLKGE